MAQIKGNSQNETIALLLASAQVAGHQESWIQSHRSDTRSADEIRDDEYMNIMEWIAQCFVLEKVGDVAAVASELSPGVAAPPAAAAASASAPKSGTASAPVKMNFAAAAKSKAPAAPPAAVPAKIKLLVTNNKGKLPTPQNMAFGRAFVTVLNDKIKQDATFYSGSSNKANLTKAVDDLMRVVVEHGWPRVASKISKVKEVFSAADRADAVGKVLKLWGQQNLLKDTDFVEQVSATGANGKKRTPEEILDIRIATLKSHSTTVMRADPLAPALNTTELKLVLLQNMCNSCKYLLQAIDGVMKRGTPFPMPTDVDLKKLTKLRRRLWRVLRYSAGPQLFLTKGITYLKLKINLARGNSSSIEFEEPNWVAKTPTLATLFSAENPLITINKETYISWFRDEFTKSPGDSEKKQEELRKITRFCNDAKFNNGMKWRPSLHCEVALLAYLNLTGKVIIGNAIGVSKLNCFACSVYAGHLRTASQGIAYRMTGTSGKSHHQWLIPNSAVFAAKPALKIASDSGTEQVKRDTKTIINNFLNSTTDRTSIGSDSSTGSGTMNVSDVTLLVPTR